jgi:outer membrane protein TolC
MRDDMNHSCSFVFIRGFCRTVLGGLVLASAGCMTPEKAYRESNETGVRLATEYWQRQTGSTNAFDFHRSADALTLRVALLAVVRGEQGVVFPALPGVDPFAVSNGVLTLPLREAMCVAGRNDRSYQNLKEAVFTAALDLDLQQYQFDTTFSGMMLAVLSGDMPPEKASGRSSAGFARRLESGAEIAGSLAVDVVSLLRDDWRSLGLTGDLTMAVPLMRGAGREIVREPLTQAERNLFYAIQNFEYYRQTYAVSVAQAYFKVLEAVQGVRNALDNEKNLAENSRRADMMFEAGLLDRIQLDQAHTDLLSANKKVIDTRKSYEVSLDELKMKLGLPPEARVEVDFAEVDRLDRKMEQWAAASEDAVAAFPDEAESCRIALAERRDLFVTRGRVEDAARAVKIAADALRADVTLTGGASLDRARATGDGKFDGGEAWDAGVRADFPWNRRKERNAFRKQLIALEQAKRGLEQQEDAIKQAVRAGRRNLVAARASYVNQVEALKVAKLRVDSNALFLQAGRSSMRDVLEAQKALLEARNALSSVLISWQMSDLELRRDMGVLEISDAGMWLEADGKDNG